MYLTTRSLVDATYSVLDKSGREKGDETDRASQQTWALEFCTLKSGFNHNEEYLVVGCIVVHVGCEATLCGKLHSLRR